jgi:hypothetical protein
MTRSIVRRGELLRDQGNKTLQKATTNGGAYMWDLYLALMTSVGILRAELDEHLQRNEPQTEDL